MKRIKMQKGDVFLLKKKFEVSGQVILISQKEMDNSFLCFSIS